MRKPVFKSFLGLVTFYYLVGLSLWFFSNEKIQGTLERIGIKDEVSAFNALQLSQQVLPFLFKAISFVFMAVLFGMVIFGAVSYFRNNRTLPPSDELNGVSSSIGNVPKANWNLDVPDDIVEVEFEDKNLASIYRELDQKYKDVINEVVSLINERPDAFVGTVHNTTLLNHTLSVLAESLPVFKIEKDPLIPVIAASHDLGKLLSHVKEGDEWVRKGNHDTLSGLIISQIPSFQHLSKDEQEIVLTVLKYNHKPYFRPILHTEYQESRASKLLKLLKGSDSKVTKEEKAKQQVEFNIESFIKNNAISAVSNIEFYQYGLSKGTKAGGWRSGEKIYVLESSLREAYMKLMPPEIADTYPKDPPKNGLHPLSKTIIKVLSDKKASPPLVLLNKVDKESVRNTLVNIKAGQVFFKAVLSFEIQGDVRLSIPDSPYEIEVIGSTFGKPKPKKKKGVKDDSSNRVSIMSVIKDKPPPQVANMLTDKGEPIIEPDAVKRKKNAAMVAATLGIGF